MDGKALTKPEHCTANDGNTGMMTSLFYGEGRHSLWLTLGGYPIKIGICYY